MQFVGMRGVGVVAAESRGPASKLMSVQSDKWLKILECGTCPPIPSLSIIYINLMEII